MKPPISIVRPRTQDRPPRATATATACLQLTKVAVRVIAAEAVELVVAELAAVVLLVVLAGLVVTVTVVEKAVLLEVYIRLARREVQPTPKDQTILPTTDISNGRMQLR